jgi:hypothetical protein
VRTLSNIVVIWVGKMRHYMSHLTRPYLAQNPPSSSQLLLEDLTLDSECINAKSAWL